MILLPAKELIKEKLPPIEAHADDSGNKTYETQFGVTRASKGLKSVAGAKTTLPSNDYCNKVGDCGCDEKIPQLVTGREHVGITANK